MFQMTKLAATARLQAMFLMAVRISMGNFMSTPIVIEKLLSVRFDFPEPFACQIMREVGLRRTSRLGLICWRTNELLNKQNVGQKN